MFPATAMNRFRCGIRVLLPRACSLQATAARAGSPGQTKVVLLRTRVDRTPAATRRPFRVGLVLLAWAAVFAGLWLAREVLLLGFLGVLIAVVFSFPVDWLSRWMPRGVAGLLVLLLLGGLVAGLGALAGPILSRAARQLRERT